MKAYHWLTDSMRAGSGDEAAWKEGEERSIDGVLVICERGYHSSPTPFDGLQYAQGPVLCLVEISEPVDQQPDKYVSRTRKLIRAINVEHELRVFACDVAEEALLRERERGREPDERSWNAIAVARRYNAGEATKEERDAAWDAARAAARDAAWAAARAAAWDAARDDLKARFNARFEALFTEVATS